MRSKIMQAKVRALNLFGVVLWTIVIHLTQIRTLSLLSKFTDGLIAQYRYGVSRVWFKRQSINVEGFLVGYFDSPLSYMYCNQLHHAVFSWYTYIICFVPV